MRIRLAENDGVSLRGRALGCAGTTSEACFRHPASIAARKALLAAEANRRFEDLLRDTRWLGTAAPVTEAETQTAGGITSEVEEAELEALDDWVDGQGLPRGLLGFDYADPVTGGKRRCSIWRGRTGFNLA